MALCLMKLLWEIPNFNKDTLLNVLHCDQLFG